MKNNTNRELYGNASTLSSRAEVYRLDLFKRKKGLEALLLALIISAAPSCGSDDDGDKDAGAGDQDTGGTGDQDTGAGDQDVGAGDAGQQNLIQDPISIDSGKISGTVENVNGKEIRIYKGIPYAAPPVEELRWKPPQPVDPWTDVLECTEWADQCAQPEESAMGGAGEFGEDCLHLNLVTPAKQTTDKLPVMVFFHGGGLSIHTGNSPLYNHTALPAKGVVVVTVNNRLGPMGYMALAELSRESEKAVSGNYGTLDLIASLQWVKENITAFGGDPNNVTIFGESGGGTKVISVMSSPLADGLYHRAIVESGSGSVSPLASFTLEASEEAGQRVQDSLGVTGENDEEVLEKLRAKPWREIIEAGSAASFNPRLTVDGYVLPDTVYNIFSNGEQGDVPLIVGAQASDLGTELQENVPLLASLMSNVSSKAYVYVFTHLPPLWKEEGCSAFHGLELPYVFGYIPDGLSEEIVLYLSSGGGCSAQDPGSDETDEVVAENCMNLWSQFAKTGEPDVEGLPDWPDYTAENDTYLEIGDTLTVKTGVADAYVAPPPPEAAPNTTYSDTTYGFTVSYPEDWVSGGAVDPAAPKVMWRVGRGTNYIPSLRFIVRPESDGADLEAVFETHLTEDAGKTISSFTESAATINGLEYTKAEVSYSASGMTYDSMIIGRIVDGEWYIFEVYTVATFAPFSSDTQQEEILNSVSFP
ncbi:MAG: carboxylesterase family protein [Deltaproteobacteria bacterium]|nr:carboxylesterase family protein [Deltaproteobacteria bacterium]